MFAQVCPNSRGVTSCSTDASVNANFLIIMFSLWTLTLGLGQKIQQSTVALRCGHVWWFCLDGTQRPPVQGGHCRSNMSSGCANHISVQEGTSSLSVSDVSCSVSSFTELWEWWWNLCWGTCHWLVLCLSSSSRNQWVLWPLTLTSFWF